MNDKSQTTNQIIIPKHNKKKHSLGQQIIFPGSVISSEDRTNINHIKTRIPPIHKKTHSWVNFNDIQSRPYI